MSSKLPTSSTPLIRDPDLSAAVESMLTPFSGKALEAAQSAVRRVHASGVQGMYSDIVEAYRKGVADATAKAKSD